MERFTQDGVVYETMADGNVRVVGYADAPQAAAPQIVKLADPTAQYAAPTAQVSLEAARARAAEAAAQAPYQASMAANAAAISGANAVRAQAEAAIAQRNAASGNQRTGLTPQVRAEAISGYRSAQQLNDLVKGIEQRFAQGPGATEGVAGLADYLPTTANQQFDAAGNAVRGLVGQALGFTGGQLNTQREAEMAVGPYIPQANDRDDVIRDKIERLKGLAASAQQRSIEQLGGAPDSLGNITTPATAAPAPVAIDRPDATQQQVIEGNDTPTIALATGKTETFADPTKAGVAAQMNKLLRGGASDAKIRAYGESVGAQPASVQQVLDFRRTNPSYKGKYDTSDLELSERPIGAVRGAINSAAQSPLGAYTINAADALSLGTLDNLTADPALARAGMAGVAAANPTASVLGQVTGGALAAAGGELGLARAGVSGARAALGADALFGAGYGAGTADDGNRLLGAAVGGGAGVAGGMFGRGVANRLGQATRGVQDASVRYLRERGVPLTVGQALGRSGRVGAVVKGVEDRLTGLPGVGAMVNARRLEGFEGYDRAAFDQALAPINASTNGVVREQGIDAARAAVGNAYDQALGGVQMRADAPFVADMRGTMAAGRALPEPMAGNADYTLNTRVGNSFDPNGGLTGNGFQQSIRGLRRDASAVSALPYGHDFGQVTRQAEIALEGMLSRQSPGTLPAYNAANEAFRNIEILRDAVNRGRSGTRVGEPGLFAASQLSDAAAANAKRFGNSQGTTRQPFFDLTRAGQNVLPSAVADSGTAGRYIVGSALLGGSGAAGYGAGGTEGGATAPLGLAALLALGGTRGGQRALSALVADRPDALVQIGNQIVRRQRIGGMFGAGVGASAAPLLTDY